MVNNTLLIDPLIYQMRFIEEAIENYHNITQISLIKDNGKLQAVFNNCIYPIELTVREFENHLIELCNIRNR
jgi:hypothetical protein